MFRDRVLQHYREKGYALRERVKVRGQSGAVHACDLVAQGPLGNLVVQVEDYGGFEGPELEAVRRIARDVGATPVVAAPDLDAAVRRHAARLGVVVLDAAALDAPAPVTEAPSTPRRAEPAYPPWPDPDAPRDRARTEAGRDEGPAWPADGRARPEPTGRMDPGEVDDLVGEWTRPAPRAPTRRQDPGFWRYGRDDDAPAAVEEPTAPAPAQPEAAPDAERAGSATGFSWLGPQPTASDEAGVDRAAARAPAERPAQAPAIAATRDRAPEPSPSANADGDLLRWLVGFAVAGASAGAAFLGLGALLGLL